MDEAGFLNAALAGQGTHWDGDRLRTLSSLEVPHAVLGRRRSLLRADAGRQWAQWFAEGLVDPRRYSGSRLNYARIFADALEAVDGRFPDRTREERRQLASAVGGAIRRTVEQIEQAGRRTQITRSQKSLLIAIAGEPARCWICGTAFDEAAVENFIHGESVPLGLRAFVDVLKPRGLSSADGAIQIDHVLPVALGGGDDDNLALACGWCNRYKSAAVSIYDVEGRPRDVATNSLGISSLPQPFWVVRQLGIVRHCEHVGGCHRDATNSPMTVAPVNARGVCNPQNLATTCLEHDPMRAIRLQPARDVKRLWNR